MTKIKPNGSKERMDERLERMHEIECRICDFNINGVCKLDGSYIPKIGCACGNVKPITNADNIRAMTDEELSIFFSIKVACFFCPMTFDCEGRKMGKDYCKEKWLNWLKSELEKESE